MTKILLALLATVCVASGISDEEVKRIASGIFFAEGGAKARVSHGILSVKTRNAAHARAVCLETVRKNWWRWSDAGFPGDFIEYLGNRYCPVKGDRTGLNRHWVKNVRARLPARRRDFSVR